MYFEKGGQTDIAEGGCINFLFTPTCHPMSDKQTISRQKNPSITPDRIQDQIPGLEIGATGFNNTSV